MATLQRLGGFISLYSKTDTWYTIHLVGFPALMCVIHFVLWGGILLLIEYRDQLSGKLKGQPKVGGVRYNLNEINLIMVIGY